TATRIGQLTKDLAAAAESSGKKPRKLLASAAKAAGGFGPAASRRARAVESPVPRAASASKSAARPAAGGIKGPPSHHSAWARGGAVGAVARLPGPAGTGPMPVPSGGPGSAAGGFGVAFSIFLALAGFLLIALVGVMRPLRLCAEPWRAAPHLLIPERPG